MGMPVNSYTILQTLASGPGSNYEGNILRNALNSYNLFSFVLYDPEKHILFHDYLEYWFKRLDFSTGKKFLFFALVTSDEEWKRNAGQRDYYPEFEKWEARQLASGESTLRTANVGISVSALALSLNIPLDNLPCIVVTNDFDQGSYFWIPTSTEDIKNQLQELGYIAEVKGRYAANLSLSDVQSDLKKRFPGLVHEHNFKTLSISMARTMSEILSFAVIGSDKADPKTHTLAINQVKKSIKNLYSELQQFRSPIGEPTQEFERLSEIILFSLSQLNRRGTSNLRAILPLKITYLEPDTKLILKTAYKVYDLLHQKPPSEAAEIYVTTDDWSPCLIGFSKVFEKEINVSIVQWLRQEKGIEMPLYFLRPKPGHTAQLERVNLNREYDGEWQAPGIGQSERVFENYSALRLPPGWDQEHATFLLENWGIIREKRNSAAHDRIIDEAELNQMLAAMRKLARKEYFTLLYLLKSSLRP